MATYARIQSSAVDLLTAKTHHAYISPYDKELTQFPYVRIRNTTFKTCPHHQVHPNSICLNAPMRKTIETLAPRSYNLDVQGVTADEVSHLDEAQKVQVMMASIHLTRDYANMNPIEICAVTKDSMLQVDVIRRGQYLGFKLRDQLVWVQVVNIVNGSNPGFEEEYYTTYRVVEATEIELVDGMAPFDY